MLVVGQLWKLSFAPGLRLEDDWTSGDFLGETWTRSQAIRFKLLIQMVGAVGIEPTTSAAHW
jgi:hypothetical protein